MKTCFQIAECSLSYAKIMQMSAMKTCFQIAECSLSYAKIELYSEKYKFLRGNLMELFACFNNNSIINSIFAFINERKPLNKRQ